MAEAFVVQTHRELIALHRVFREAKSCLEPDDTEISDSPTVAAMFDRLMAIQISWDVEQDGEYARQRWQAWLKIDESRDEWDAALRRAKVEPRWKTFTDQERTDYVTLLLNPFIVDSDLIDRFVTAVNRA